MNSESRAEWIDRLLEGELSEEEFLRLEAELSVDAAARHEYYDRLLLSTLLEAESATASDSAEEPVDRRK